MTKVLFLDLRVLNPNERAEMMEAFGRVLDHGRILLGPEVDECEHDVGMRVGQRYAVGCNPGRTRSLLR